MCVHTHLSTFSTLLALFSMSPFEHNGPSVCILVYVYVRVCKAFNRTQRYQTCESSGTEEADCLHS